MEMSHNQEWLGKATKKQTAAISQTIATMAKPILETFWFPRCSIWKDDYIRFQYKRQNENINPTEED